MIAFKCKMCGGEMELEEGATVAECPYCLTKQTLPKLDNGKRANMYDRANHFRRQNEYDKAMAIFESILQEDRTDAEAYWSLVLCRYGIEYVEDPATHKRVPTVNRVQYTSILADEDYKSALEYADFAQRSVYESEAKAIDEIQKGILAISKQEKPFDVFICYKETDANGRRTPDSVLANDLYHQLTNEGFKVFFSRITLEDKIGTAYEPYIFAALNSAKVMVVLGTKPEYFNAVWVKNEWSRYLALIRAGADKTLVPAYRDMDPYDLPDEFSHLQAQDMSKLGFMQDLIRGIKKLTEQKTTSTHFVAQQSQSSGANIESLLKRARLFMEDGDFKNASEYLDRVLDIDPECSAAYAAKVCVAFGLRKEQDLANTTFLYQDNTDWQKAVRFASPQQKTTYDQYISKVKMRVTTQIRHYAYDCAVAMAVVPDSNRSQLDAELTAYKSACLSSNGQRANGGRRQNSQQYEAQFKQSIRNNEPGDVSEQNYKTAASMFEQIKDEEAQKCVGQCRALAEQARQKNIYYQMVSKSRQRLSANELDQVASSLESIPDYSDAKSRAENCRKTAEDIRKNLYTDAQKTIQEAGNESRKWKQAVDKLKHTDLNGYRDVSQLRTQSAKKYDECVKQEEEDRKQARLQAKRQAALEAKKRKRNAILGVVTAIIIVAAGIMYFTIIKPSITYNSAIEAMNAGDFDVAIQVFESLGNYNDASVKVRESQYQKAKYMREQGNWDEAIELFNSLQDFNDASIQVQEMKYQKAKAYYGQRKYTTAYLIFRTINNYKDVDLLLQNDEQLSFRQTKLAPYLEIGNIVKFGKYEMDNVMDNGKEEIEWLVLDVLDGKVLLLSKYALEYKSYINHSKENVTWEKSTLREWLNNDFFNQAFTEEEQSVIFKALIDNSYSQRFSGWTISGGMNTEDYIFLLSYAEANKYLDVTYDAYYNSKAIARNTAYAKATEWYIEDVSSWWLRSPGAYQNHVAVVNSKGTLSDEFATFSASCRPALWLALESDFFLNK